MQRELRRYENRLVVIGTGVIGIGLWSMIKVILSLVMDDNVMNTIKQESEGDGLLGEMLIMIVFLVVVVLIVGWHVFIGMSARSEGFGKRSRWMYLLTTLLVIAFYVFSMKMEIEMLDDLNEDTLEVVVSLLIDGSVVITLGELLHAAIRVKLYRHKLKKLEVA